ncbi:hypothetical protein [Sphingomonas sp. VNH70]|uniref:hypothetical protein n=1 Tax=Sphingomonas silueang TaxID=3156617 RepID=UPI0032B34B08
MVPAHLDRRAILGAGTSLGLAGLFATAPLGARQEKWSGRPFGNLYTPSANGAGMIGPWGEVRAARLPEGLVPYFIQSANKLGVFDYSGRMPFVRLGGAKEIRLTPAGIELDGGKPYPWDKNGIAALKSALKQDRKALSAAMQMRSSMVTSFTALAVVANTAPAKGVAATRDAILEELGNAAVCTVTRVTETVVTVVERTIEVVQTAAERYAECYDDAVKTGKCGPLAGVCAAAYCTAKGFAEVAVGLITILDEVITETVRDVITCAAPLAGLIPNKWDLPGIRLPDFELKNAVPSNKEMGAALDFLKKNWNDLFAFLGPHAKCLVEGKWSIEQAGIPFVPGVGIPYGLRVCITATCARTLFIQNVAGEMISAFSSLLTVLAALVPQFAAATQIPVAAGVAAAIAALPAGVVPALIGIVCFLAILLRYASSISFQLSYLDRFDPGVFADGEICISHPTIAVAVLSGMMSNPTLAGMIAPTVHG